MIFFTSLLVLALSASQLNAEKQIGVSNCGVRPLAPEESSRIIGGTEAIDGDFGWTVSLNSRGSHFCGGVLVNPNYILSAAHCFANGFPANFTVLIGAHNRNALSDRVQIRRGAKLFVHERYDNDKNGFSDDIALIKLNAPVEFDNKYIVPACVDESASLDASNKVAYITGWGRSRVGGPSTIVKNQLAEQVFDQDSCQNRFTVNYNKEAMICAIDLTGKTGSCQGDSGGPLVYQNPADNLYYVIGLTSFGFTRCNRGTSYTRVNNYIDWIKARLD